MIKSKKNKVETFIIGVFLLIGAIFAIQPILHIIALSFTNAGSSRNLSGLAILPKGFTLFNYKILLQNPNIIRSLLVSIFITLVGTGLSILFTITTSYVLTRKDLIGKQIFMFMVIVIMVFEPGIVPEFIAMRKVGLTDSLSILIFYKLVNVYYLILLMRFFENIPEEIIESAKMEGAGHLTILFKVLLPLVKSGVSTIAMFYFVFRWNEYFRASIYISNMNKWPLQVVLRQFVVLEDNTALMGFGKLMDSYGSVDFKTLQAAAIVLGMSIIFIIYPLILKFFTKGTFVGAVKE